MPGPDQDTIGLTPAGAGNTDVEPSEVLAPPAYPRRCGEHGTSHLSDRRSGGLPPQVRGTPVPHGPPSSRIGLTPQVRGTLVAVVVVGDGERLTPAGAGNTAYACSVAAARRAYPRRCGEHDCD